MLAQVTVYYKKKIEAFLSSPYPILTYVIKTKQAKTLHTSNIDQKSNIPGIEVSLQSILVGQFQ